MATAVFGRSEHLFLSNDTNRSQDQFEGRLTLSAEDAEQIARAHDERRRTLNNYLHIVVPNKECVMFHEAPVDWRYQICGLTPLNAYFFHRPTEREYTFYDSNYLRALDLVSPTFAKTDTHWTHFGAIKYLHKALNRFQDLTEVVKEQSANLLVDRARQLGDLGSKLGMGPEEILVHKPATSNAQCVSENGVQNEGHVRLFQNEKAALDMRVLVVHDSTGNWLAHALRELFGEVLMIHTPDLDLEFATRFRPDLTIMIQIERFFARIPKNSVDYLDWLSRVEENKGATKSAVPIFHNHAGANVGEPSRYNSLTVN